MTGVGFSSIDGNVPVAEVGDRCGRQAGQFSTQYEVILLLRVHGEIGHAEISNIFTERYDSTYCSKSCMYAPDVKLTIPLALIHHHIIPDAGLLQGAFTEWYLMLG